jgi:hypothetical protein
MDTTVIGIGSVVVAELRAAGYLESTIGQYARTIKGVHLSERWLISGCFGHAARLSRSMVSWS